MQKSPTISPAPNDPEPVDSTSKPPIIVTANEWLSVFTKHKNYLTTPCGDAPTHSTQEQEAAGIRRSLANDAAYGDQGSDELPVKERVLIESSDINLLRPKEKGKERKASNNWEGSVGEGD